jgi:hypothetical protein
MSYPAYFHINQKDSDAGEKLLIQRKTNDTFQVTVFHDYHKDKSFTTKLNFEGTPGEISDYLSLTMDLLTWDIHPYVTMDIVIPLFPSVSFPIATLPKPLILKALNHFMKTQ